MRWMILVAMLSVGCAAERAPWTSIRWSIDPACMDWTPEWDDAMRRAEIEWSKLGVDVQFGQETAGAITVVLCLTEGSPNKGKAGYTWVDGDRARIGVNASMVNDPRVGLAQLILVHEVGHVVLDGGHDHLDDGECGVMSSSLCAMEWTADDVRHLEEQGLSYSAVMPPSSGPL